MKRGSPFVLLCRTQHRGCAESTSISRTPRSAGSISRQRAFTGGCSGRNRLRGDGTVACVQENPGVQQRIDLPRGEPGGRRGRGRGEVTKVYSSAIPRCPANAVRTG